MDVARHEAIVDAIASGDAAAAAAAVNNHMGWAADNLTDQTPDLSQPSHQGR
jgi:DNA-binding GntR family transcriptional regulator